MRKGVLKQSWSNRFPWSNSGDLHQRPFFIIQLAMAKKTKGIVREGTQERREDYIAVQRLDPIR